MKNSVFCVLALGASIHAIDVDFPRYLDAENSGNQKVFGLKVSTFFSAYTKEGKVSEVKVEGVLPINGHRGTRANGLVFSGNVQLFPEVQPGQVVKYLKNARLKSSGCENGSCQALYTIPSAAPTKHGNERYITLSTRHLTGRVYSCPLPSEIKVKRYIPTSYVKIVQKPDSLATGSFARYVKKGDLFSIDNDNVYVKKDHDVSHPTMLYTYEEGGKKQFIASSFLRYITFGTVRGVEMPLAYRGENQAVHFNLVPIEVQKDAKESTSLYYPSYEAPCGDYVMTSRLPGAMSKGLPTYLLCHENETAATIPPLRSTVLTRTDDNAVKIECMYCDSEQDDEPLVLATQLDASPDKCFLFGKDLVTHQEYVGKPLSELYPIGNRSVAITSSTHEETVPTVGIVVKDVTNPF